MKTTPTQMLLLAMAAVVALAVAGNYAFAQTDPGRVQGPTPISGVRHNPFPTAGLAPDGGTVNDQSTAGGVKRFTHDGMCVSTQGCILVNATNVNDGGTATLTPGQWYSIKVKGSGGDGCMRQGFALTSCALSGRYPIEAGERWREAFRSDLAEAFDGGTGSQATLFFLATSATSMTVTLCPVVPCN